MPCSSVSVSTQRQLQWQQSWKRWKRFSPASTTCTSCADQRGSEPCTLFWRDIYRFMLGK